ncbi:hypothetical protein [Sphingomonas swuensis]|uniref:hypothetical protein n=1 Tax=Sphingomonas swuensis TaxID=977800 RepID=UPI0031D0887D
MADTDKGEQMEGCASWQALFYQADGQYLQGEVTGRWSLDGTTLERHQIAYAEGGGDEEQVTGEEVRRVERVSADRMREVGPDKKSTLYLRCPLPETPVAP